MKPLSWACAFVLAALPSAGETLTSVAEANAVNLEELESAAPEVEFEKTELPEVETLSEGGEAWKRAEIMRWLNKKADGIQEAVTKEHPEYKPLTLEDLIPETPEHEPDPEDAKRFTQTLTKIDWEEYDDK